LRLVSGSTSPPRSGLRRPKTIRTSSALRRSSAHRSGSPGMGPRSAASKGAPTDWRGWERVSAS
jgi:hypothetical protein